MSHECIPVTSDINLEETTIPIIFPATDYDHVDSIFFHNLPPPDHHDHRFQNNDMVGRSTGVDGVGAALSTFLFAGDEKAAAAAAGSGTLESIIDQANRLIPTTGAASTIYHDGNNLVVNDDMDTWFGQYNPQPITDNSGIVMTNVDTYEPEIEHRNREEEIYAANEADADHHDMDSCYVVTPSDCKDGWMAADDDQDADDPSNASLLTYSATRSVAPDHHHPLNKRERRKVEKQRSSTTLSANRKIKETILHKKAERKRRDRISQRMEALQRLVPSVCYKTDKATMLGQAIEYIKKLQTQNQMMMSNMMTYPMMIPMSMPASYYMFMQQQQQQQQQLQMSMMASAQMSMDLSLGSIYTNPIMHPNMIRTGTRTPAIVHPTSITPPSHCDVVTKSVE